MKSQRLFFLLLLLSCAGLHGQTFVSGPITTNTTWTLANSPYRVTGDVTVMPGTTLLIQPGVKVLFDPNTRLGVRGRLKAIGQDSARILMTAFDTTAMWKGIVASGDVDFQHVVGRKANTFLRLYNGGFGLTAIRGCVFSKNDTAIYYDGKVNDSLHIYRSEFILNTIGVVADSNTLITRSWFHDNVKGVIARRTAIRDSRFTSNGLGLQIAGGRVVGNSFTDNQLGVAEANSFLARNRFLGNATGLETQLQPDDFIVDNGFNQNARAIRISPVAVFAPGAKIRKNAICNSLFANVKVDAPSGNTADLRFNCWCESDSATIAGTILDGQDSSAFAIVDFMPLDSMGCGIDLVFPGDANHNQIANVFDLFPIGMNFGSTGPVRPNASLFWVGQMAPDWGSNLPNGKDLKHTDCNGDGIINAQDVAAIFLNYGKTHNSLRTTGGLGLPIQLIMPSGTASPGDTITFSVALGSASAPVKQLYALGFMLTYDTALVDQGDIQVSFSNSFLGTENVDMIAISQELTDAGQLHIGMTRTDQTAINGYGLLADITVVIDDDIMKKDFPLEIAFLDAEGMDVGGNEVLVYGESSAMDLNTAIEAPWPTAWSIYPNPTNGLLTLNWQGPAPDEVVLYDLMGREMATNRDTASLSTWDLSDQPQGVYNLRIRQGQTQWHQTIIISR